MEREKLSVSREGTEGEKLSVGELGREWKVKGRRLSWEK